MSTSASFGSFSPSGSADLDRSNLCRICSIPLQHQQTEFGQSRRCIQCQTHISEIVDENLLTSIVRCRRWDVNDRQELLPVTLEWDRAISNPHTTTTTPTPTPTDTTTTAKTMTKDEINSIETKTPNMGGGLGKYKFAPHEIAADTLHSEYFITGFDCFECTEYVALLKGSNELPSDYIEMCDTIWKGMEEMEIQPSTTSVVRTGSSLPSQQLDRIKDQSISTPATSPRSKQNLTTPAPAELPNTKEIDEKAQSTSDPITSSSIIRTVSAFLKDHKAHASSSTTPTSTDATSTPTSSSNLLSRAPTLAMPFPVGRSISRVNSIPIATVREETLSDMEVASDMSRSVSIAPATAAAGGVHTPIAPTMSTMSIHPPPATSPLAHSASIIDGQLPVSSPVSASIDRSVSNATVVGGSSKDAANPISVMESEFKEFIGLDSLQSDDAFANLAPLDDVADGADGATAIGLPGLRSTLSTYLSGAHLGVETESVSGLNVRSFSMARSFSMQFGAALDEFTTAQGGGDGGGGGSGGDGGGSSSDIQSGLHPTTSIGGLISRQPSIGMPTSSTNVPVPTSSSSSGQFDHTQPHQTSQLFSRTPSEIMNDPTTTTSALQHQPPSYGNSFVSSLYFGGGGGGIGGASGGVGTAGGSDSLSSLSRQPTVVGPAGMMFGGMTPSSFASSPHQSLTPSDSLFLNSPYYGMTSPPPPLPPPPPPPLPSSSSPSSSPSSSSTLPPSTHRFPSVLQSGSSIGPGSAGSMATNLTPHPHHHHHHQHHHQQQHHHLPPYMHAMMMPGHRARIVFEVRRRLAPIVYTVVDHH